MALFSVFAESRFNVSDLNLCFVEPFYGTISLYNRERREKLSEDFYFRVLPTEMQDVSMLDQFFFSPSSFVDIKFLSLNYI